MKISVLLFFFLSFYFHSNAQTCIVPDSIAQRINAIEGDIAKIEAHLALSKRYRRTDPDKRVWHARVALELAEKSNQWSEKGKALGEIGSYFRDEAINDSARIYFNQSFSIFKKNKDRKNVAVALTRLSSLEENEGDLNASLQLIFIADSLFRLDGNTSATVNTNVSLASIYVLQNDYQQALNKLKKAEEIVGDDINRRSIIYNNMIGCYVNLDDYDNAYLYSTRSIELAKKTGDKIRLSNAYNNLAAFIFTEKGATIEVIELLEKALQGYLDAHDNLGVIRTYNNLGGAYRSNQDYKLAAKYLTMASILSDELNEYTTSLSNKREWYKLYNETQEWEKAFQYFSDYKELEDSIRAIQKVTIIQDLQIKYESTELKRENELANANQLLSEERADKNQKVSIMAISLGLLGILILLFVFSQFRQKKKREFLKIQLENTEKKLAHEQQQRKLELKAIRSQMNPHFIFNILNSIQDLILSNNKIDSVKYLGKFGELTRQILINSNLDTISVADEIALINLYTEFEMLRFGKELKVKIVNQLTAKESEEAMLPSMLLQPYIENAFKHGLLHKKGEKNLEVKIHKEDTSLICTIFDNGIGRKKANEIKDRRQKNHLNFSTAANVKRIDLLNEDVRNKINLVFVDHENEGLAAGTTIKISFSKALINPTL